MKTVLFLFSLLAFNNAYAQGPQLIWAKAIKAEVDYGHEDGKHMAVDVQGAVYTAGHFRNTVDFDPGPGTYNLTATGTAGYTDIYIQKLDAAGGFLWAKSMGGYGGDFSDGIALDAAGNVYVVGSFDSTADFDPGTGSFPLTATPNYFYTIASGALYLDRARTSYICKLTTAGDFAWAKKIDNTEACTVATDRAGNVYTTGYFKIHADFDPGPGTAILTPPAPDSNDCYLLKLNSAGDYIWAKQVVSHGAGLGDGFGIPGLQIDAAGNIYTCGTYGYVTSTTSDFDPGPGTFIMSATGYSAAFISRLDSSGNLVWAKKIDGVDVDLGQNLTFDVFGNVYFTGAFDGAADLDPGPGTANVVSAGGLDAFIVKLDAAGNYKWSKTFGDQGEDFSNTVRTDAWGNVYIGGGFGDTVDFDPGPGTANRIAAGFEPDGYIMRMDSSGNFGWVIDIGKEKHDGTDFCWNLEVDAAGSIYATGGFSDTVDFDPGSGNTNLVAGYSETFVMKLSQPGLVFTPLSYLKNDLRIYPNPTTGMLTVESRTSLRNARVRITDVNGRMITGRPRVAGASFTFDMRREPAGMYFVEVTDEYGSAQRLRLIKQ